MGKKKRKHQKENKDDVERSIKRMKRKLREQEEKIERLKKKRRRYSSTSSSSSDNEEDLRRHMSRGKSPLFPVDQILKELNNIDPQTNQLKNKSVPANTVQSSKDPGVTTAPVATVAADPQDGTTPGVPESTKAVSNDSAQGLEPSGTTKSATETSGLQESAPKTSEEVKLDEKMLEALGKRLDPEKKTAPPIHNDLFLRWKEILKNGLPKEERENNSKSWKTFS